MLLDLIKTGLFSFLFLLICSCNQNETSTRHNQHKDTLLLTDNVVIKDSLDNDTSSVYITTGFPKDVHDTIYTTNEILWNYVRKGYYESSKLDSTFSFDMFRNILLQDNFSIDTSDINETYYYKNFFNRRGTIRIGDINKKEFSFTIQTLYWHDRKKYRVVELFILKKRKSNTDILTYHYIY